MKKHAPMPPTWEAPFNRKMTELTEGCHLLEIRSHTQYLLGFLAALLLTDAISIDEFDVHTDAVFMANKTAHARCGVSI